MEMKISAENKVVCAKVDFDSYEVNKAIETEAQVGWKVKQIIYINHTQEVMILFEREDAVNRVNVENFEDIPF